MRLLLALLLLAPAAAAQEGAMTHVLDYRFAPRVLNATSGSVVTVMSFGPSNHSMTGESGAFDVELPAPPAKEWTERSFVAPAAGDHPFRCRYHANMTGVLHVRAAATPPARVETPGGEAASAVAMVALLALGLARRAQR